MDVKIIIIHCTDSLWGDVDEVRRWHLQRGFNDIGYHYLILNQFPKYVNLKDDKPNIIENGKVAKGRKEDIIGAHCRGHNHNSLGISLVGVNDFTDSQIVSLNHLLSCLIVKYNLEVKDVYGHYEFDHNKSCPNINMPEFRIRLAEEMKNE